MSHGWTMDERAALLADISEQVSVLKSTFTWNEADRAATKRATHALVNLAKKGKSMPLISSRVAAFALIAMAV
ncbi:putative ARM REPEAT PROTEIN INTERACTING WITH ABF2-like isoform [Sesbania bispinosa]|nr:putative ARM REPEAT PROTEIN INTERACTING WITH ABF2-like isoform [Sesbania bispinosa]